MEPSQQGWGGVSTGCPPSKVPQLWAPNGPEPQSGLPATTRPFRGLCRAEGLWGSLGNEGEQKTLPPGGGEKEAASTASSATC